MSLKKINLRFGVCCLFLYTASGSTIVQNCSYIRNPGFPSAYTGTSAISYTIQKCSSGNIYQIRYDIIKMREPVL